MKVIVLAGGKGTRLAPYTTVFPKPLVPLGDTPIIDILVRQLEHYGFLDLTLSLGHLAELIMAYFSAEVMSERKARISFVRERSPLGTVGALGLVPDLNETFMTINGDTLTTLDFRKLVAHHKQQGAMLTIAMHRREIKIDLGVLEFNDKYEISGMIEKPTYTFNVSTGIYVYEPEVRRHIVPGEKLDFPDLVAKMLRAGDRIVGYPCDDYWLDLGTHADYERAQREFESIKSKILPP
jgi:NDP-sugar pyrophosphorylase family protein